MCHSIKRRKREIKGFADAADAFSARDCPSVAAEAHNGTLMTYYVTKKNLRVAYERAYGVFDLAFEGMATTQWSNNNPYNVVTVYKALANGKDDEADSKTFQVMLRVYRISGTDEFAFQFVKILGDSLDFNTSWQTVEPSLLAPAEVPVLDQDGKPKEGPDGTIMTEQVDLFYDDLEEEASEAKAKEQFLSFLKRE